MSVNRKSCSFEIGFDDVDPSISTRSQFASTKLSKSSDTHGKAADERMAEVLRRKSDILQVSDGDSMRFMVSPNGSALAVIRYILCCGLCGKYVQAQET